MNGLSAAKGLRRSVERAGGVMRISVPALGDAFGRGRMTDRARRGIEQVLARAELTVDPPLTEAGDGWVTLTLASEAQADPQPPGAPGAEPAPDQVAEVAAADEGERRGLSARLARPAVAATAIVAVLFVVLSLVSGSATDPDRVSGTTTGGPAETAPPEADRAAALEDAEAAVRDGDYRTAVRLVRGTDPSQLPALRERISEDLLDRARRAQRRGAHNRAIQTARRAAWHGPAPGAKEIVRRSRRALAQRRARRRAAEAARLGQAAPGVVPPGAVAP